MDPKGQTYHLQEWKASREYSKETQSSFGKWSYSVQGSYCNREIAVTSPRIAHCFQVPVTVGNSQMAPVYAGPDQDSFPSEVTFSSPVSILPDLHIFPN